MRAVFGEVLVFPLGVFWEVFYVRNLLKINLFHINAQMAVILAAGKAAAGHESVRHDVDSLDMVDPFGDAEVIFVFFGLTK